MPARKAEDNTALYGVSEWHRPGLIDNFMPISRSDPISALRPTLEREPYLPEHDSKRNTALQSTWSESSFQTAPDEMSDCSWNCNEREAWTVVLEGRSILLQVLIH